MNAFIVYAHPEPKSFGRSLLDSGTAALVAGGHTVVVSDLYGMGFNPVASADDFLQRRFPDTLHYDREQKHAREQGAFTSDIQGEIDKLVACDLLVLQFPLWWFSVPAMLKGWIDRVFVNGVVYGMGRRFDTGGMRGKRAMVAVSTACYPEMAEPDGLLASLDVNLWHLQHSTLAYAGFDVLPPFVAWSVQYASEAQRLGYVDGYAARLAAIESDEPMPVHRLSEFGDDWRLKPGIAPRTAGHRRVQHDR